MKLKVIQMMNSHSQVAIAKDLNISRGAVQHIIKKFKEHVTIKELQHTGRLSKITPELERKIVIMVKINPFLSLANLQRQLMPQILLCKATLCKILCRHKLRSFRFAKKTTIYVKNIKKRLI